MKKALHIFYWTEGFSNRTRVKSSDFVNEYGNEVLEDLKNGHYHTSEPDEYGYRKVFYAR